MRRPRLAPSAALVGGALVGIGAFLPWLSFYAGLVPMGGTIGLYGRLLAAGGLACAAAGAGAWLRPARGLERALLPLAAILAGFAAWLLVQLLATYEALQANRMIVPRLGPGLFIALAGALLAAAGAVAGRSWRSASPAPGR